MGQQDDQLEQLRQGETLACEQFVHKHAIELYGWLYRLTGRREEAEDLTQDTFAAFWESIRRRKPVVEARIWLFSIARNLWRQHCRHCVGRPQRAGDLKILESIPASTPSALGLLEQDEMSRALETAVADLEIEFREVFSLRVWQHWEYADIASLQGVSPGLVRWRFFRARQRIRERLAPWFNKVEHPDE